MCVYVFDIQNTIFRDFHIAYNNIDSAAVTGGFRQKVIARICRSKKIRLKMRIPCISRESIRLNIPRYERKVF